MPRRTLITAGVALGFLGASGLTVGELSFFEERRVVRVGVVEASIEADRPVKVPEWLALVAVLGGFGLVSLAGWKRG
ncbi:MAG TPA: hypothetical protein VK849_00485 [Longimicrobiales bacterium]|nr:hypothetical protein [Longimicrobiales bacterium]